MSYTDLGRPPRVLLSGAYGGYNLGDEVILSQILMQLGGMTVTALSGNPEHTEGAHQISAIRTLNPKSLRFTTSQIGQYDALVIGGGEIFQESRRWNPLWGLLTNAYLLALQAVSRSVPVFCWSVGVDELASPICKRMARSITSMSRAVTVRDEPSRERLITYGAIAEKIHVCADPAFTIAAFREDEAKCKLRRLGLDYKKYVLCVPAVDGRHASIHDCLKLLHATNAIAVQSGARLVVLLMDDRSEFEGALLRPDIRLHLPPDAILVSKRNFLNIDELTALHRGAELVVSSRMHSVIIAATQGTMVISCNRSAKMQANSRQIGVATLDQASASVDQLARAAKENTGRMHENRQVLSGLQGSANRTRELFMTSCL